MIAAYYLASRAMRPISELNNEIGTMDGNSLSKRLRIPETKDEIEKTPLAAIMTSTQVLKFGDDTTVKEYRENLDITLQSVRRLSNVLDGLLMLGRPDEEIVVEAVNIASCRSGNRIIIRISNTGIGIPSNDIEHIFEPFYRADKSRSRKTAGAGLGLSIAKEIFDLHKAVSVVLLYCYHSQLINY